jgi:hypothetical protein
LRTVESESRCTLEVGFGDTGMRRGGGGGLAMRRGLVVEALEGASVGTLEGQANLIVHTRFGGSSDGGAGAGFTGSSGAFFSSLGPHANMMHRFLPSAASTICSLFGIGLSFSSSCETTETGNAIVFLLSVGNMPWNAAEGSGGLGVQGRVPGLVKPSLVRSAVPLVLLHVEMHDNPRTGLASDWSSTGELAFEPDLRAVVRSDSFRSRTGFDLLKDAVDECCRTKGAGRCARGSGGSSTSATKSSSVSIAGAEFFEVFCRMPICTTPCLPRLSCSFAMAFKSVDVDASMNEK